VRHPGDPRRADDVGAHVVGAGVLAPKRAFAGNDRLAGEPARRGGEPTANPVRSLDPAGHGEDASHGANQPRLVEA
jgi:hypothetical protein